MSSCPRTPAAWVLSNQSLPSGPVASVGPGEKLVELTVYSVIVPFGVISPTLRGDAMSVNHMFPSGAAAMLQSALGEAMPARNSLTTPLGVIRPITPFISVYHMLPSGPSARWNGPPALVVTSL